MKKIFFVNLAVFSILSMAFLIPDFPTASLEDNLILSLTKNPLSLQVNALRQSRDTSCGEAVITMAYNYIYSDTRINEQAVIEYAIAEGYFTEYFEPYTSPASMVRITQNYTNDYSSGAVKTADQGLMLLLRTLKKGDPVIIDILDRLGDANSAAHFVLVTGLSIDSNRNDEIIIHYNDPFTGRNKSSNWSGEKGIWYAWENNDDPGGSGWWLVISSPR